MIFCKEITYIHIYIAVLYISATSLFPRTHPLPLHIFMAQMLTTILVKWECLQSCPSHLAYFKQLSHTDLGLFLYRADVKSMSQSGNAWDLASQIASKWFTVAMFCFCTSCVVLLIWLQQFVTVQAAVALSPFTSERRCSLKTRKNFLYYVLTWVSIESICLISSMDLKQMFEVQVFFDSLPLGI